MASAVAIVPARAYFDREMTSALRDVLGMIALVAGPDRRAVIRQQVIADWRGCSRQAVGKLIRRLIELGYLQSERRMRTRREAAQLTHQTGRVVMPGRLSNVYVIVHDVDLPASRDQRRDVSDLELLSEMQLDLFDDRYAPLSDDHADPTQPDVALGSDEPADPTQPDGVDSDEERRSDDDSPPQPPPTQPEVAQGTPTQPLGLQGMQPLGVAADPAFSSRTPLTNGSAQLPAHARETDARGGHEPEPQPPPPTDREQRDHRIARVLTRVAGTAPDRIGVALRAAPADAIRPIRTAIGERLDAGWLVHQLASEIGARDWNGARDIPALVLSRVRAVAVDAAPDRKRTPPADAVPVSDHDATMTADEARNGCHPRFVPKHLRDHEEPNA